MRFGERIGLRVSRPQPDPGIAPQRDPNRPRQHKDGEQQENGDQQQDRHRSALAE